MRIENRPFQKKMLVVTIFAASRETFMNRKQEFLEDNSCLDHHDCVFVRAPFDRERKYEITVY